MNWLRYSVAPSTLHKKQKDLRKQVLQTKADLQATSSQDQFARWAKLRRKLDKEVAELETLSMLASPMIHRVQADLSSDGSITNQKAGAQTTVTAILFILTTAAPFVYTSVHSKSAVFYPPRGWFGPFERFLSLPFGPAGWSRYTKSSYSAHTEYRCGLMRNMDDGLQAHSQADWKGST